MHKHDDRVGAVEVLYWNKQVNWSNQKRFISYPFIFIWNTGQVQLVRSRNTPYEARRCSCGVLSQGNSCYSELIMNPGKCSTNQSRVSGAGNQNQDMSTIRLQGHKPSELDHHGGRQNVGMGLWSFLQPNSVVLLIHKLLKSFSSVSTIFSNLPSVALFSSAFARFIRFWFCLTERSWTFWIL